MDGSDCVADRLSTAWQEHLSQATGRIGRLLEKLLADHPEAFAANKAFTRYHKAVLNGKATLAP